MYRRLLLCLLCLVVVSCTSTPSTEATRTPRPTNTERPTRTPRPSHTPTPTGSPTPTATSERPPTATLRPTNTPTPTRTPIPVAVWIAWLKQTFADYQGSRGELEGLFQQAYQEAQSGNAAATLTQIDQVIARIDQAAIAARNYPAPPQLAQLQAQFIDLAQQSGSAMRLMRQGLAMKNVGEAGADTKIQEAEAALRNIEGLLNAFVAELNKY